MSLYDVVQLAQQVCKTDMTFKQLTFVMCFLLRITEGIVHASVNLHKIVVKHV